MEIEWGFRIDGETFIVESNMKQRLQKAVREALPTPRSVSEAVHLDTLAVAEVAGHAVEKEFNLREGVLNERRVVYRWVKEEINTRAGRQILQVNGNDPVGARQLMDELRAKTTEYADRLFGSIYALNNSLNEPTFRREGIVSAITRQVDSDLMQLVWVMASVAEQLRVKMTVGSGESTRWRRCWSAMTCCATLYFPNLSLAGSGDRAATSFDLT